MLASLFCSMEYMYVRMTYHKPYACHSFGHEPYKWHSKSLKKSYSQTDKLKTGPYRPNLSLVAFCETSQLCTDRAVTSHWAYRWLRSSNLVVRKSDTLSNQISLFYIMGPRTVSPNLPVTCVQCTVENYTQCLIRAEIHVYIYKQNNLILIPLIWLIT